jgi:hypothetical protein
MRQAQRQATTSIRMALPYLRVCMTAVLLSSCFVFGCAKHEQPKEQTQSTSAQPSASVQTSELSPPKLNEVEDAVKRVFKDAALIDSSHDPSFVAGDFNGDNSQDIAVILKPAPDRVAEMNQEFPPWILKDPFANAKPGMPPPRVAANELLLAVIHGYGRGGWRDPQATQTYLLKNSVGADVKSQSKTDFLIANEGKKLPRVTGDLIAEGLRGKSGCLYFAGATYDWYDAKSFKGDPEVRVVHPGMAARTDKTELFNLRGKKEIAPEK